jgi:glycosyltransferase involved in cell wall biosynthesis
MGARFIAPKHNDDIEPCLCVVMPVYNEEKTIDPVIETVLAQRPTAELVIVDDRSSDGTWAHLSEWPARDPRVKLFRHEENLGKGAALRTAISQATAAWVIVQDADLEYDPGEYYVLLAPVLSGKADVVFGTRFGGGAHRVLYYWHSVGNRVLTTLSNMFTDLSLTDMEVCYKLFRRDIIQGVRIEENRFGFEPEITAKVARLGVRIYEVPVTYSGRTYAEGKKIGWKDGFSAIRCIVKYGLS